VVEHIDGDENQCYIKNRIALKRGIKTRQDRDSLWKEIIENMFFDFLIFFIPDLTSRIDFSKGYTL
jgi:hypothetical protein